MTARVLVVDDIVANVKLLEARLSAEYFDVLTAYSGREALEISERERTDVVLLDVMMPGLDGFEVCRRMKQNPKTSQIPVIMVTALDTPADKVQGLEAGADDFLTKPVDEIALITRVKNLARLKMLTDEMAMRASTSQQMGIGGTVEPDGAAEVVRGRVLLIDDHPRSAQRMGDTLARHHEVDVEGNPQLALQKLAENDFDLAMVSLSLTTSDGLRVCSQIRSLDRSRHTPVIILVEPGDDARLLRGLDMGVNDYVMRPIDRNEMLARVRTQIKRKRHSDTLRNSIEQSVEAAITDSLTGLHNRRYLESHLRTLMSEALRSGRPLSVLVMDIDHFKHVNDTYGHQGGDLVLKELGRRLQANTRSIDLSCRYGGEEFVVIMPDTEIENARFVAERLRSCIAAEAFRIDSDLQIPVTSSIGIATLEQADDTCESVLARADKALYAAKRDGRNRVVADAA